MYKILFATGVLMLGIALGYGLGATDEVSLASLFSAEEQSAEPAVEVDTIPSAPVPLATPMPELGATRSMTIVQQRTGTICQTSTTTCTVSPQTINTPCRCGNLIGRIVR